jgi:hypothetical protein
VRDRRGRRGWTGESAFQVWSRKEDAVCVWTFNFPVLMADAAVLQCRQQMSLTWVKEVHQTSDIHLVASCSWKKEKLR